MMPRYKSAEEVEQEHLQAMGSSLGPLYHALYNDVVWLHAKWQQFRKLFDSPENVDLLNHGAGFFFWMIRGVMGDDVLLHLARLVDPPMSLGSADKTNLTLQALPTAIRDSALALKVYALVEEARSRCAFAKDWRDRRYAHRDLELALNNPGTVPLARAERTDVEAALESIRAALGAVHGHYLHMDPGFERFIAPATDADALLDHLRRSRGEDRSTSQERRH